ncbi:response regulator [Spongiimicrobium salis]|uniref:DNA-binding response regulator n=1 Tax=Spongiimicrobium salis TaxID=1667022 RepID=UPI00374CC34F
MFKKVLIAEDFQATHQGIQKLMSELGIDEVQEETYCDTAYNRLMVAYNQGIPYEVLITDLRFKESHVEQKLSSGNALIEAIRKAQPQIKILVYSMRDNLTEIQMLFEKSKIDAYVCKGRQGLKELKEGILDVYHGNTYCSPQINRYKQNNAIQLDDFDMRVLRQLAGGHSKRDIVAQLKKEKITPNSESMLDKRVSKLFDDFEAKNTTHLIAILTRNGIL